MKHFEESIERIEQATKKQDEHEIIEFLKSKHLALHPYVGNHAALWQRLLEVLATLWMHENTTIANRACWLIRTVMTTDYNAFNDASDQAIATQRFQTLWPALHHAFMKDATAICEFTKQLFFHRVVNCWYVEKLESLRASTTTQLVPFVEAALLEYRHYLRRSSWEESKYVLFSHLDHPEILVRAYAAKMMGEYYSDDAHRSPSLENTIAIIQQREIQRPGIAGPFISDFYTQDNFLENLQRDGGISLEWIWTILEHRKGPEPWLHPCSNNIDFYAHEIFCTESDLKRLIRMGHFSIAYNSATCCNSLDLKKILQELSSEDLAPEVFRRVACELFCSYGILLPEAETRGIIRRMGTLDTQVFSFLNEPPTVELWGTNFDMNPAPLSHALLIRTTQGSRPLTDDELWKLLSLLFPGQRLGARRRNAEFRNDDSAPSFENLAQMRFFGSAKEKIWSQAIIFWNAPIELWDLLPEAPHRELLLQARSLMLEKSAEELLDYLQKNPVLLTKKPFSAISSYASQMLRNLDLRQTANLTLAQLLAPAFLAAKPSAAWAKLAEAALRIKDDVLFEKCMSGIKTEPLLDELLDLAYTMDDRGEYALAYPLLLALARKKKAPLRAYNNLLYVLLKFKPAEWPSQQTILEALNLAVPHAKQNSFIYHNAACLYVRVGEYEKALDMIEGAITRHYPKMKKIWVDEDLRPLFETVRWKELLRRYQEDLEADAT